MALARYEGVAVNLAGDVIPNATVEVRRDQPGRPVVPLWADRNGTVPLGNPITTDAEGKFGFHVTGGSYYIRIFTGPSQQPLQQYVRRYQAIGTAAERDVEDLATALEAGTATFPTLAELEAFTPAAESVGGKVTTGDDAGFYHYDMDEEEWVFDRPLFDTLARMVVTGGTADAIEAETATGVADSAVVMLWIEAPGDNTGTVTINGKEVLTASGNSLIAGQWNAGRTYWFSDEGANYKLRTESDVDGIATQVEIWANETLDNKNYAEEWAQSDDPISVEAGGDGVNDKSSKAWAVEASNSAAEAAGYAAGVNIAPILPGDAGKILQVNAEEDGSVWRNPPSTIPPDASVTFPKLGDELVQTDAEGGDADADNEIPTVKRVARMVKERFGGRILRKTNLLPFSTFIRGLDGWVTPRTTAGASILPSFFESTTDLLSIYFGRAQLQLYADATGKSLQLGSAKQFGVKSSQKYKVGATLVSESGTVPSTLRVMCYAASGAHLGTLTVNASVPATVASVTSNVFTGVINEAGGSAPAWPAGTVSASVGVGFSSTAAQGIFVSSFWFIGDDEYPGNIATAPTYAMAGGTHEAIAVGDYIYVINHSLSQLVKFDKDLKKVATLNLDAYPHDILRLGDDLWIASQNAFTVQRVNIASFTVVNTYAIPGSRWGFGLATDGTRLWCGAGTTAQGPTLYQVNTTTGAFTALSTDVNDGSDTNIPVRFADGSVWSAHLTNGQVKRINPTGGATIATISCGLGPIYGLGVGEGWVFANCREGIAQIDPATNTVVARYRYRETSNGQSNVEVLNGRAYGGSGNGIIICDLEARTSSELVLDSGSAKWVRAMPDGRSLLTGAYAGPWMFLLG